MGGPIRTWINSLEGLFFRIADKVSSPRWFLKNVPKKSDLSIYRGRISLEVVSHCWNYSHLLAYNLSSYVNHPPKNIDVTVTVFYSEEDQDTVKMLEFFSQKKIPSVTWNWQAISTAELLRRAIGRNKAALETKANWIWFTDCDLIFHENCLDNLAETLQGKQELLVYPDSEQITSLLEDDNPLLKTGQSDKILKIKPEEFHTSPVSRAVGPYQITHGDVARACGYCNNIRAYQTPQKHWRKTYEDRTYRWLLGTQGTAIKIPGVYRIRHISKGRYTEGSQWSPLREKIRQFKSRFKEDKNKRPN